MSRLGTLMVLLGKNFDFVRTGALFWRAYGEDKVKKGMAIPQFVCAAI